MEKLVYLVWAGRDGSSRRVAGEILEQAAPRLLELAPRALTVDVADLDVAAPIPWPGEEAPLAAVASIWLDRHEDRTPFENVLADFGTRLAGYLVTESLCSDYGTNSHAAPRSWPDGERSPGLITVTLMERPARLSPEKWLAHWHGVQSPLSEEMQPRTRYVRNAVVRPLFPGAPPYEGIVEEAWPSAEHVTNPDLFYGARGSPERLRENQRRMFESVKAFLDFDRIRTVPMSEYLLRGLSS